ncbi:hypothetical protein ACKVEX_14150 [Rhodocyclaceae bacterium SMB388]
MTGQIVRDVKSARVMKEKPEEIEAAKVEGYDLSAPGGPRRDVQQAKPEQVQTRFLGQSYDGKLSAEDLDRARMNALTDIRMKHGDVEGGLAMRQSARRDRLTDMQLANAEEDRADRVAMRAGNQQFANAIGSVSQYEAAGGLPAVRQELARNNASPEETQRAVAAYQQAYAPANVGRQASAGLMSLDPARGQAAQQAAMAKARDVLLHDVGRLAMQGNWTGLAETLSTGYGDANRYEVVSQGRDGVTFAAIGPDGREIGRETITSPLQAVELAAAYANPADALTYMQRKEERAAAQADAQRKGRESNALIAQRYASAESSRASAEARRNPESTNAITDADVKAQIKAVAQDPDTQEDDPVRHRELLRDYNQLRQAGKSPAEAMDELFSGAGEDYSSFWQ